MAEQHFIPRRDPARGAVRAGRQVRCASRPCRGAADRGSRRAMRWSRPRMRCRLERGHVDGPGAGDRQRHRRRRRSITIATGCAASSRRSTTRELERRAGATQALARSPRALEANPKAVLFEAAGRDGHALVGNALASRTRFAQGVRRHAAEAAAGNPAAAAQQAGVRRGRPRRGAGAAGGRDRRRHRSHQAAGASAARQGRRALHLRRHGFRARSGDRLHQCRPAPLHGARPRHHRHRSRRAERPAQHLSRDARARRAAADERRGRRPSGRLFRRHHAHAGRRDRHCSASLRARADAGGQERHQRSARAGRRRMGARRLSRRGRLQGAGRALRRIPRLLRRRQDQSGVPRHRDHAPARRAVPDAHHRRRHHEPHRHRAAHARCAPRC